MRSICLFKINYINKLDCGMYGVGWPEEKKKN